MEPSLGQRAWEKGTQHQTCVISANFTTIDQQSLVESSTRYYRYCFASFWIQKATYMDVLYADVLNQCSINPLNYHYNPI